MHGFQDKGLFWGELLGMLINGEDTRVKGSRSKKRKPLGGGLSSYQLFRGALDFLGESSWFSWWWELRVVLTRD